MCAVPNPLQSQTAVQRYGRDCCLTCGREKPLMWIWVARADLIPFACHLS